jgi:hypothetical protein
MNNCGLVVLAQPRRGATTKTRRWVSARRWWVSLRSTHPTFLASPPAVHQRPTEILPVPSATYTLFRNAILGKQQVTCVYDGRRRELCPHIIGTNKADEEVVLAWQFSGESSGPLPQWRCLRLARVRHGARPRRRVARGQLTSHDANLRQHG